MAIQEPFSIKDREHVRTGPGTIGGRYLRSFWQPVFHGADLMAGRTAPLRIMGEDFTLYRGDGGKVVLVAARCPHRAAQLSAGWVTGDTIRCFYHGWRFDAGGACLEQPPEDSAFSAKVSIRSYPTREYLGLIFAYLGEGEPPVFPLYPEFEHSVGFIEVDSYYRGCNYFQNLENALDMSHVEFVHSGNEASFSGIGSGLQLAATESTWGIVYEYTRPDGAIRRQQFGMPNIFYMTALPTDAEIGWQESLFWWVPIDDRQHMQFSLHRVPATGDAATTVRKRRERRRSEINLAHQDICEAVLTGQTTIHEIDPRRVDLVRLQDDIAQIGQGRIADRSNERLGRGDVGVIAIRKTWYRELSAFANGMELKLWQRTPDIVPTAWLLAGNRIAFTPSNGKREPSEIVDVRPFVEIEIQLNALRRTGAMTE